VGVLASGRPAILANLALRFAGFTPVNIGMVELDELPAALLANDICTVISDNMEVQLPGVQIVDLSAAIRDVDFLRLGMGIVGAYVLPKSLLSWLVRRRRRHDRSEMEAVAWLRAGADNSISYHSLTHVELLAQSEQLRNVDSCREGETVCSPHGFASVEGTVLGLWNTILAGATLCASVRQATVIVTNRLAWEALCETNVGVRYPRAVFLCGGIGDLRPLSSIQTCPVHRCFVADELERFVTMSLPEPILPSKTAEPQVGSKPGAMGRLLPGYQVEELGNILTIICPDGKSITVPNGRLDSEDFLFIQ
jgi:hypothetical protein